jgi:hemerythrin-like domain-containing protein
MLRVLFTASQKMQKGEDVDPRIYRQAVDFIRNFADKCHHSKEEDNLFPSMEKKGVPRQGGPIGIMLVEHDEGRAHVRELAAALDKYEAGDKSATVRNAIVGHSLGYARLLADHIEKEDNILYTIADDVLSSADQDALYETFERIEEEVMGADKHEEYLKMVDELEKAVGRA